MSEPAKGPLVWICKRHAVNPATISDVFYGTGGEIQVTFIGGRRLELTERDLSPQGQTLLLPAADEVPAARLSIR